MTSLSLSVVAHRCFLSSRRCTRLSSGSFIASSSSSSSSASASEKTFRTFATTTTTRIRRRRPNPLQVSLQKESLAQSDILGSGHDTSYTPTHDETGESLSSEEYFKKASMSPWVPTPDISCRRMLEVARVTETDVHVDLGSGDGRLCFHAIDPPFSVAKSTGLEVDEGILKRAQERLLKRHPPPPLEFHKVDLLKDDFSSYLQDATVLTMFFVPHALDELKPILKQFLKRSKGGGGRHRIITCGYEISGWESQWTESVLGLPVHLYNYDSVTEVGDLNQGGSSSGGRTADSMSQAQQPMASSLSPGPPPDAENNYIQAPEWTREMKMTMEEYWDEKNENEETVPWVKRHQEGNFDEDGYHWIPLEEAMADGEQGEEDDDINDNEEVDDEEQWDDDIYDEPERDHEPAPEPEWQPPK